METISKSVQETEKIAGDFIASLLKRGAKKNGATAVGLLGDLGTGKTTFVQKCGLALGIPDLMQSPTFVIERRYSLKDLPFEKLIHIDAYRIEDPNELRVLHFEDDLSDPKNLIIIEWADRVDPLLPKDSVRIVFSHEGADRRGIRIASGL
jgi:tRNA threonylcarbamoyladenosine biosynthesis protein TsaE